MKRIKIGERIIDVKIKKPKIKKDKNWKGQSDKYLK